MRRQYEGGASKVQLDLPLGNSTSDKTIYCSTIPADWPGLIDRPFYIVIGRNTPTEEKILCSSRSGNILYVYDVDGINGRAADGSSLFAHNSGDEVEHIFTATDADEANAHVNAESNVHGVAGQVVGTTDIQSLENKTLEAPEILNGDLQGTTTIDDATVTGTFTGGIYTNPVINTATIASPTITGGTASNFPPIGTIVAWAGTSAPADGKWLLCNGQAVSTTTYADLYAICGTNFNVSAGQSAPLAGTFRVPILTGRVPVGAGDSDLGNTPGATSGSKASTAAHTHAIDHDHGSFNTTAAQESTNGHQHTIDHGHASSGSTTSDGAHQHNYYFAGNGRSQYPLSGSFAAFYTYTDATTHGGGGHSHNISVSVTGHSGSSGYGPHTHNVPVDVPALTGTSGASSAAVATIGNVQPFIIVNYIIKAL